jgi:hypothetical protein
MYGMCYLVVLFVSNAYMTFQLLLLTFCFRLFTAQQEDVQPNKRTEFPEYSR